MKGVEGRESQDYCDEGAMRRGRRGDKVGSDNAKSGSDKTGHFMVVWIFA
jgi:hypothetical protein